MCACEFGGHGTQEPAFQKSGAWDSKQITAKRPERVRGGFRLKQFTEILKGKVMQGFEVEKQDIEIETRWNLISTRDDQCS